MTTTRLFDITDFIRELKANGRMEARAEMLNETVDNYFVFRMVMTGLTRDKDILRFEWPVRAIHKFSNEEDIKKQAQQISADFETIKKEIGAKESISFKSGIFED